MLPPVLQNLLDYYRPLCTFSHGWPEGGESLLAPGTNLLGANAAYLPEDASESALAVARDWAEQHDLPPLRVRPGSAGDAGQMQMNQLRVGVWRAAAGPRAIQVEQTSRLHLPRWADVLAEAYGQAEWAVPIARHLATRLEQLPDATLLLAYAGHEAVGALLWQPGGAHLWGTLDAAVDAPLLNAAADLSGGELSVSLPDSSPLSVIDEQTVSFGRLA